MEKSDMVLPVLHDMKLYIMFLEFQIFVLNCKFLLKYSVLVCKYTVNVDFVEL